MRIFSIWIAFFLFTAVVLLGLFALSKDNECTGVRYYACAAKSLSTK